MQGETKTANIDFQIYSLCVSSYLYNFLFTFKVFKVNNLKKKSSFTDFSAKVY